MLNPEDLILIFAIAMLLFGANKLPELARSLGSSMGEFQKAQRESELNMRRFEKPSEEPSYPVNTKIQEIAKKLGIDINGKTEDQLLDEIQRSAEKPKEVPEADSITKQT
jgi:sec-independent protein translocase protein TatA